MKKTATIINIVSSMYKRNCISEFTNSCQNQITFNDYNYSYIGKLQKFEEETYNFLNQEFFRGNVLKSKKADYEIKKIFFNKFLNREINKQTFDLFLSDLLHLLYIYDDILSFYYDNIEKYFYTLKENNTNNNTSNITDNRSIYTTLPQNEINLDLNNDLMGYGDNNTISKEKNTMKGEVNNTLSSYDFEIINSMINKNIIEKIFNKIDKKCFLQIW